MNRIRIVMNRFPQICNCTGTSIVTMKLFVIFHTLYTAIIEDAPFFLLIQLPAHFSHSNILTSHKFPFFKITLRFLDFCFAYLIECWNNFNVRRLICILHTMVWLWYGLLELFLFEFVLMTAWNNQWARQLLHYANLHRKCTRHTIHDATVPII